MSAPSVDTTVMSAECAVAQRREYAYLHGECRQTKDVPLIHGHGILLVRRCGCTCHRGRPKA